MELARRALAAAQRLAPDHGETSLAAGKFAYACEADYPKALRYFELSLRWNPNDASVRGAMGTALRRLGRHVEGAAEIEKAFALDPAGNAGSYSQSLLMLRRYREYLAVKERELRLAGEEDSRQRLHSLAMWPRFEITGDRDRFFRELGDDVAKATPSRRLGAEVRLALHRGDWEGTLALLSEERLAEQNPSVAWNYFVLRARMAHVLGRRDIVLSAGARARALVALDPSERFRDWLRAQLEVDLAALLGRAAEFQRAADALHRLSQEDRFIEPSNLFKIATGHLILGDKATALQHLETLMTGPSPSTVGPRSIRLDPFWGKLAGDARFEEILRNAKPL
jgi:tetratricopeptide (TPR) repeat protein